MYSQPSLSTGSSIADMRELDGLSSTQYGYPIHSQYMGSNKDGFGFDPAPHGHVYHEAEAYSPGALSDLQPLSNWGFDTTESKTPTQNYRPNPVGINLQSFELDRAPAQSTLNPLTAVARYGTLTPPRSNSASSEDNHTNIDSLSPNTGASERRKRSARSVVKEELPATTLATTTGRKRKNTRRTSTATEEHDDKRRQSLEKNRLAAAKCRVNKKEKTEQLQRDSHDKAVHNAFLRDQIMRMKEEVQQMNALLLAHANCSGCKSPEEVQKHLSNLGHEFFPNQMSSMGYGDCPQMNLSEGSHTAMHHSYYDQANADGSLTNQSLPDFNGNADFEVHTPMQTD